MYKALFLTQDDEFRNLLRSKMWGKWFGAIVPHDKVDKILKTQIFYLHGGDMSTGHRFTVYRSGHVRIVSTENVATSLALWIGDIRSGAKSYNMVRVESADALVTRLREVGQHQVIIVDSIDELKSAGLKFSNNLGKQLTYVHSR